MNKGEGFCELERAIGRLLEVQEQERTQIARELHDNIGSSLAVVGIELLKSGQPGSEDIQALYQKVQEIGSQVSTLSNQLRPPMLKYFGLAKAIEAECREFSESCHIPVSCSCKDLPKLDSSIALGIFRVVQEALRNAGKHSHASGIAVNLGATPTELTMTVSDDGDGFDAEQTSLAAGLGLISMRERMRSLGGEFEIRSRPGRGTTISCRTPLVKSAGAWRW